MHGSLPFWRLTLTPAFRRTACVNLKVSFGQSISKRTCAPGSVSEERPKSCPRRSDDQRLNGHIRTAASWRPNHPLALRRMTVEGRTLRADRDDAEVRNRRISRIAVRPGEGPLSDHTADVQPERRQPLLMPHIGLPLGAGQDRSGAVNGSAAYCENVNQNCPSPIGRDMRRY